MSRLLVSWSHTCQRGFGDFARSATGTMPDCSDVGDNSPDNGPRLVRRVRAVVPRFAARYGSSEPLDAMHRFGRHGF